MSRDLRAVAAELRSDYASVAAVWHDDTRRMFAGRFFEPGMRAIHAYFSALDDLGQSLEDAEQTARSF